MIWSKYIVQKKQEYSGGTWVDVVPSETRQGEKIGDYSTYEECVGESPFEGKFKATYSGGTTYSAECDSSTELTTADTKPSGYDYTEMTSAIIGDCITSIGTAFQYCSSLSSVTIPNSVTSIGVFAFNYCTSLTDITIPSGVTSIANNTFYYCTSLQSIVMSDNITSIGNSAFEGCENLTSITIPSGVTSIGNRAFSHCAITSIEIPNSVTSIGQSAFSDCSSLSSIKVNATIPPTLGSSAFAYTNSAPIYVPCDSVEFYKSASGWSAYASRIQAIPGSCIEPTFEGKFYAEYSGGSTTYSAECDSSTTLTSGDTRPSGYQYSAMTSAIIGDCAASIGNRAFYGYDGLTSIVIQSGVTSIGEEAFWACNRLASVTIGSGVTSIGNRAFRSCRSIANIVIPDSVTSIGQYAFENCYNLINLTIGSGVTNIGDYAFKWCSELTSITIPDSVKTIGRECFGQCSGATSVVIGSGVTSIGQSAFSDCSSLNSITCYATTPPTLTGYVEPFGNTNDCPIYVPASSINTYKASWNRYITRIYAIPT